MYSLLDTTVELTQVVSLRAAGLLARFEPEDVAGFGFVRQFGDDGSGVFEL